MKSHYENEHSRCKVAASDALPSGVLEVSSVSTDADKRGKGWGTRLMQRVCRDADLDRSILFLRADVSSFYERFGFVTIQSEPVLMARQPINIKQKSTHDR